MANQKEQPKKRSVWKTFLIVILILWVLAWILSSAFSSSEDADFGVNVAIIPIKGEINIDDSGSFITPGGASSEEIINQIDRAEKNPEVKAIILDINSPGGGPVASEEVMLRIKNSNKYTVAVIREIGTSGAYWIASAADRIYARPMSITGSVGVTGSYIEWAGLMDKYNVKYVELHSGKYKEVGNPYKNLTTEEFFVLEKSIDQMYVYFLDSVAENRLLTPQQKEGIQNSEFFTGKDAKELGLIDDFGGKDEAIKFVEGKFNMTARPKEFVAKKSFIDLLAGAISEQSFHLGQGIGDRLVGQTKSSTEINIKT